MELTFFHESLLTVTRVLKMNVVLIKECTCIHSFSQTENAFSIDREWACESNTIQQNIHLVQNACMHRGISWTTGQTIVSDTNKILPRDIFMFLPYSTQLFNIRLKRCAWFIIVHGCRTRALILPFLQCLSPQCLTLPLIGSEYLML